jgi:hypothetical protein
MGGLLGGVLSFFVNITRISSIQPEKVHGVPFVWVRRMAANTPYSGCLISECWRQEGDSRKAVLRAQAQTSCGSHGYSLRSVVYEVVLDHLNHLDHPEEIV